MSSSHFIVTQRGPAWQFSYKGDITAPFATKEAAVDAAIAAAQAEGGSDVEVLVQDTDMRTETVWRQGGAALSGDESARLATEIERDLDA